VLRAAAPSRADDCPPRPELALVVLFGFLGMALATPLAAVVTVLSKMLYVEAVLGDEITPR
jgi:hypothetical protein